MLPNGHQRGANEFVSGLYGEVNECLSVFNWELTPVFNESACPVEAVESHVQFIQP